ncbi:MAG: hypothetical protein ACE5GM_07985 [bacterium]
MRKHSVKIISLLMGAALLTVPVSAKAWTLFGGSEKKHEHHESKHHEKSGDFKEMMGNIINSYLIVQKELASDKTDHLAEESKKMLKTAKELEELIEEGNHTPDLHEFHETVEMEKLMHYVKALSANAANIKESRHIFKQISSQLVKYVAAFGKPDNVKHEILYIAHCPMYEKGSDWVQLTKEIKNPYYGSMMLACGSIKSDSSKMVHKQGGSERHEKHEHNH